MKPKFLFLEKDHLYIGPNGHPTSTSAFIGQYENKFDSFTASHAKVFKDLYSTLWSKYMKEFNNNTAKTVLKILEVADKVDYEDKVNYYLNTWALSGKTSSEEGTLMHKKYELEDIERGTKLNPYTKKTYQLIPNTLIPEGYDNCSMADNLYDLEDGYYPEALVFNEKLNVCGLLDMLFIETLNKNRYVDIDDYKFTKTMDKQPKFFDRSIGKFPSMKEPISHIYQTNYYSYNMKISMYAWMLEQFGFIIRNVGLRHMIKMKGGEYLEMPYQMEYKRAEINLLIEDQLKRNETICSEESLSQ